METVPELGLGTWRNTDPEKCRNSVEKALNIGYRHIDTAQHYHNEKYVGEGIKASKVDIEDFFLASKVWTDRLSPGKVVESIEHSLERLGIDRIDLMYVHYPAGDYRPEETLKAFEKAVEKNLIGSIGLSNFLPGQVDEAIRIAGDHIVAHQFEMHPLLPQDKLVENSVKHGIQPVAYSPLARGEVFNIKEVQEVAEKHGVSEAQISLAWLNGKDVSAVPKASTGEHLRDNLESQDLRLDEEDVEKIDSIERKEKKVDPEYAPWNNQA